MIDQSELRINNLVLYAEDNTVFSVKEIQTTGLAVENETEFTWIEIEEFEPIPLTEEWLIRAGFKRFAKDYSLKGLILHNRKRGYIINKKIPEMKWVHQLQNYVFATKGIELEFTKDI